MNYLLVESVDAVRSVKRSIPTVVIEQRTLLREGVVSLLHDTSYKVVASFASANEIGDIRLPPGRALLVILGLSRGLDEASRAVQRVRSLMKDCRIVAIGERSRDPDFHQIMNTGVDAIVFNVSSSDSLLKALDLVLVGQQLLILGHSGDSDLHHEGAPPLALNEPPTDAPMKPDEAKVSGSPHNPHAHLSEREQQILARVALGESNKTIARALSITEATVKVHLQSILRKISVHNRTQAALWAVENGLISRTIVPSNGGNGGPLLPYDKSLDEASCDLGAPMSSFIRSH